MNAVELFKSATDHATKANTIITTGHLSNNFNLPETKLYTEADRIKHQREIEDMQGKGFHARIAIANFKEVLGNMRY